MIKMHVHCIKLKIILKYMMYALKAPVFWFSWFYSSSVSTINNWWIGFLTNFYAYAQIYICVSAFLFMF